METSETAANITASMHVSAKGHQLRMFSARYDALHFDPTLFSDYAVDCPVHISRSVRKRQAEFFYGRLCARGALESLGIREFTIETGKQREPIWPPGIVGSISHNDEYAVAVALPAATGVAVGIDIERLAEGESLVALTATVISAQERVFLYSFGSTLTYALALTIVFSAKESFYKAFFPEVQRFFDFDTVEVTQLDPAARIVTLQVKQALSLRLQPGDEHRLRYEFFGDDSVFTFLHCDLKPA